MIGRQELNLNEWEGWKIRTTEKRASESERRGQERVEERRIGKER